MISHRHPDHFDVPSLARLAEIRRDRQVFTADPFVARTAEALGFTSVRVLAEGERVVLSDGTQLLPTASHCPVVEWGMVVATEDGVVFNQVDSDLGELATLPDRVQRWLSALSPSRPRLDLALVRFQPVLQANLPMGAPMRFPRTSWAAELGRALALRAGVLVPAAAGSRLVGPAAALNGHVYPASEERFVADLARLDPSQAVQTLAPGGTVALVDGQVVAQPRCEDVVRLPWTEDRGFAHLALPPVSDPHPERDPAPIRAAVTRWVEQVLAPAVGARGDARERELTVVFADGTLCWTLVAGTARPGPATMPAHSVVCAGSVLADVLAARAPFGRAVLGGWLRCLDFTLPGEQAGRPIFLYDALGYGPSQERWVAHQLSQVPDPG